MELEQLRNLALTWSGLLAALAALVIALFLRRLLPASRRRRGRATVIVLLIAPLVHFLAHGLGAVGFTAASAVLDVFDVLLIGFGVTGILGMLVFDITLDRAGAVPAIARDILLSAAFLVVVLGALHHAGVNPLSLITTSAVLTAVIGLAFQNIMANLLAGVALQIDRTFVIGDWIQVGARTGKITQIRWRSTSILTREGDAAIIPNAQLLSNEVLNYSQPKGAHRAAVVVRFHFRHPPNEVKRVVLGAIAGVSGILADPEPECAPAEFGDAHITYAARFWIDDVASEGRLEGEARTRIWYAAQRAGLQGPCPADAPSGELDDRIAAVAGVSLFAPLDRDERARLAAGIKELRFAAGERIIAQGEPGDSLYVVRAGTVRVEVAVEHAQGEVATLGPGDFFGEMSLMTGEPRRASCTAVTDVTCEVVGSAAFQAIVAAKPGIAEEISLLLGRRSEALAGEREGLAGKHDEPTERSKKLLGRMREYFHLG
jgi:small-conductance mechanosensitive channel/CRP-like cAMP-binding protein